MSEQHGHEEVHVFETSGLEEGNAPVPRWFLIVMGILAAFFIVYIATWLTGAQPSAAGFK